MTIAVVTVVVVTVVKQLDTSKTDEISQGSFSRSRDVFLEPFPKLDGVKDYSIV